MKKPVIGISTTCQMIPCNGGHKSVSQVNSAYIRLATDFGCTPLLLYSEYDRDDILKVIDFLDGLIIIGGQDLDPSLYAEPCLVEYSDACSGFGSRFKRPLSYKPNIKRDEAELQFYRLAKEKKIPILGICRGLQLINVAEGGSLHQELPEDSGVKHYYDDDGWLNYHPITIDVRSLTHQILGVEKYFMSSLHHQGINRLSASLSKAGWADDGIIEIVEHVQKDLFVLGVHGHIEQTRVNLKLYESLLAAFFDRAKKKNLAFN